MAESHAGEGSAHGAVSGEAAEGGQQAHAAHAFSVHFVCFTGMRNVLRWINRWKLFFLTLILFFLEMQYLLCRNFLNVCPTAGWHIRQHHGHRGQRHPVAG